MLTGQHLGFLQIGLNDSVMLTSLSGAGVVATWICRCGWSASQVSVRCTAVPGPARAVFLAIAGFLIVRRIDAQGLPEECQRTLANAVDRHHSDSSAPRLDAGF